MTLVIIGGGASGMAAAIAAAQNPQIQVILLERQSRLGRKLQATGNGRCNLTNIHAAPDKYHGDSAGFVETALLSFSHEKTLSWFRSLGLFTVTEENGRVYPYSDQANSVVDVLRFAVDQLRIQVRIGFEVQKVRKNGNGFSVEGTEETICCDRLIIACGGLAGSKLGGSMSGYKLLRSLGHRITKLRPALVQIKSDWSGIASLKGVRANCAVEIKKDGKCWSKSAGEIQFTEYGVSGPVIFETSRDVCTERGEWQCVLDLLPHVSEEELYQALLERKNGLLPVSELFTGILHNRLGRVLTQSVGISGQRLISELDDKMIHDAAAAAKAFEIHLTEPMGMDSAQVTAGGAITDEFDAATMESRLVPGLYACGEVLDVDGDCGGYNLQWAWSSGYLAGNCAGRNCT